MRGMDTFFSLGSICPTSAKRMETLISSGGTIVAGTMTTSALLPAARSVRQEMRMDMHFRRRVRAMWFSPTAKVTFMSFGQTASGGTTMI